LLQIVKCAVAALALVGTVGRPAVAQAAEVALTFDDLPAMSMPSEQYVERLNRDLLAGLRRHRISAIGFVNEGKLGQFNRRRELAVLREWVRAGMDLGNHTYSHESLNVLGPEKFEADVVRGEHWTRHLLAQHHRRLRWFRFPDLETGATPSVKLGVAGWLARRGYRSAPVTIDPDDWEFAEPYDEAVQHHDRVRQEQIRAEYLTHMAGTIDWSRKAAMALFGRDIPLVALMHATRLNADCMDRIAALYVERGIRFTSLAHVMEDPAYGTPDPYVGPDGIEWLERWSLELRRELPWDDYPEVPADIVHSYDKLDTDRN